MIMMFVFSWHLESLLPYVITVKLKDASTVLQFEVIKRSCHNYQQSHQSALASHKKKNQYLNSWAHLRFLNSNKLVTDGRPHQSGMISPTSMRIVWWAAKRLMCLFVLLCFLLVLEFIIKHDHTLLESFYKATYRRKKEKILTGCDWPFRCLLFYSLTTFLTLTNAFGGEHNPAKHEMQVIVLASVMKSGEDEVKAPSSSTASVTRVEDKGSKKIHEGSPGQIYLLLTFSGQLSFTQALLEKSELSTRHNEA